LPGAPPLQGQRGDPHPERSRIGHGDPNPKTNPKSAALAAASYAAEDGAHASVRERARAAFARDLREAILDPSKHTNLTQKTLEYMTPAEVDFVVNSRPPKLPPGFQFHHLLTVADFPEFAHLSEVGLALPKDVHRQAAHGGETTRAIEVPTFIEPEAETRVP